MLESFTPASEQNVPEGYEELFNILAAAAAEEGVREDEAGFLKEAFDQAADGKGAERHADSRPWHEQPILEIQRVLGNDGFALGQAMKKVQEAERLPWARGREEFKGAIIYLAAAHKFSAESTVPEICGVSEFPTADKALGLSKGVSYRLVLCMIANVANERMRLIRLERITTAIRAVAICALQLDKERASD